MPGTLDNVSELLDVIESQSINYVLLLIEPKQNKKEDKLTIFTSLDDDPIERLINTLKKVQKQEKQKKQKNEKNEPDNPNF